MVELAASRGLDVKRIKKTALLPAATADASCSLLRLKTTDEDLVAVDLTTGGEVEEEEELRRRRDEYKGGSWSPAGQQAGLRGSGDTSIGWRRATRSAPACLVR